MLNDALTRYIDLHRSVGFKFRVQRSLLGNFVRFAEARGDEFILVVRTLDWAARAPSLPQRRNRLLTVRRFALALQAEDLRHEVPAADVFGCGRFERRVPHIYTAGEITRLMKAAAELKPLGSIRPLMYSTLFGLIAATGMRVSEALALRLQDLTEDGLIIRETKFKKSRLLPLHETTRHALDRYVSARSQLGTLVGALFVSSTGTAVAYPTVVTIFLQLTRSIELRAGPGERGPRIHDLRHTFAVRSLERCRHERGAVARHIVALSTFSVMGTSPTRIGVCKRHQSLCGRL
jgi:integrase